MACIFLKSVPILFKGWVHTVPNSDMVFICRMDSVFMQVIKSDLLFREYSQHPVHAILLP